MGVSYEHCLSGWRDVLRVAVVDGLARRGYAARSLKQGQDETCKPAPFLEFFNVKPFCREARPMKTETAAHAGEAPHVPPMLLLPGRIDRPTF